MIEAENSPEAMSGEDQSLEKSRRAAFLISLLSKRKEAITGRIGSGIEAEWIEDEEHYQGVDDANRRFVASAASTAKQWATTGRTQEANAPTRSVVFLNITAPYVDTASAAVSDMLLPTDDKCWDLAPTTIPRLPSSLIESLGGVEQAQAVIEQHMQEAKIACVGMADEIEDCLEESGFQGEVRAMIDDSARIGSGVLKGPYPIKRTAKVYKKNEFGYRELIQVDEIKPGSKHIDPWNLYPDPACGESIHNGSYTWEREYISARQLRDMIDMPGYDRGEILAALKEGATVSQSRLASDGATMKQEDQFELWIFYGQCDADDLEAYGVDSEDETPKASAMAVIVNDRLIKVALNVMDTGDFPYDVLAWKRRPGMPWGTGVSRQIRTIQRILNGALRAMMDNSGLSASPQIIIGNGVVPADGNYTLRGGKIWRLDPDAGITDVRAAFTSFVVPSTQAEMMNIIEWAMRRAEDVTGQSAMLQGIRGDAPETLGGMEMQNNNSKSVLRRLAKRMDDFVTDPHIQRYYDWQMQHSERDDIKGDFQIVVRASSALVERASQQQFLMSLLQASANPVYELDPAKLAMELIKGQRIDPTTVRMTPDKVASMQGQPSPVDQAKVELLQAQADNTKAKTMVDNVTGMFSSVQAGKEIALVPAIAPLADQIFRSAGGVDKDAGPLIPSPAEPIPTDAPDMNTNPLTPVGPDAGMMQGIEGGQQ